MPFGLKNALSTFQRSMDTILSVFKLHFALVCSKDVFISQRFVEKRLNHLQTVLGLLSTATVSLKLKK